MPPLDTESTSLVKSESLGSSSSLKEPMGAMIFMARKNELLQRLCSMRLSTFVAGARSPITEKVLHSVFKSTQDI